MKIKFDLVCDKHGWKILVIDFKDQQFNGSLWLTDQEALSLYKFVGENFNVEELES